MLIIDEANGQPHIKTIIEVRNLLTDVSFSAHASVVRTFPNLDLVRFCLISKGCRLLSGDLHTPQALHVNHIN
jgi:hypothetical protein